MVSLPSQILDDLFEVEGNLNPFGVSGNVRRGVESRRAFYLGCNTCVAFSVADIATEPKEPEIACEEV